MAEPQSKRFIQALEPVRDRLYGCVLARAESPAAAEGLLQRAVRQALRAQAEAGGANEPIAAIEGELQSAPVVADAPADAVMPADVWARLTAAVQIEAARGLATGGAAGGARGINPESMLLLPDPLLAPKRPAAQEDLFDGLNLSPPSRFLVAAAIAILLGVVLTVFIVTRHTGSSITTRPATTRAQAPTSAPVNVP